MALFVVTYDLVKDKDYDRLIGRLEQLSAHRALLSVWLVELNDTIVDVRDHLQRYVDEDDKLMVIEFTTKPKFTKAFKGTTAWIDAHVS